MTSYGAFTAMTGSDQLDVLGGEGEWLAERHGARGSSLYYSVGDFYVELLFTSYPGPSITVVPFTRCHAAFEELLEVLPVHPLELLDEIA